MSAQGVRVLYFFALNMSPILRKEVYMHDKNYIKDSSRHTRIINNYSTNHWDVYYFSLIKEKEACEWDL